MTNIPKKLPIDGVDKNDKIVCNTKDDLVCKINEIIDYLQAKEEATLTPVRRCCTKKHSTGEASKGEYLFKHDFEPDKNGKCWCNIPKESGYHYQIDPPEHDIKSPDFDLDKFKKLAEEAKKTFEHEESWEREIMEDNWDTTQGIMTKQTILRRGKRIGNATTMLKVQMIIDYIRDNFVSKEKIKRAIEQAADCAPGIRKRTLDAISKSLGLGD